MPYGLKFPGNRGWNGWLNCGGKLGGNCAGGYPGMAWLLLFCCSSGEALGVKPDGSSMGLCTLVLLG